MLLPTLPLWYTLCYSILWNFEKDISKTDQKNAEIDNVKSPNKQMTLIHIIKKANWISLLNAACFRNSFKAQNKFDLISVLRKLRMKSDILLNQIVGTKTLNYV